MEESDINSGEPQEILKRALDRFEKIAISFSGAEDVVLIDMASRIRENVRVITLDTGRLHPETYEFIDRVRERYPIDLRVYSPNSELVESMVAKKEKTRGFRFR